MEQVPGGPEQQKSPSGLPSCYRHPGVETGISCTRCERPICPQCMVSASVGFHCPECVRSGSGTGHSASASRPRTLVGGGVTSDPRLITKILIGINVAVFIAVQAVGNRLIDDLVLVGRWPPAPFPASQGVADGEWYRLLTSVFLHQQVWHIGFNMLSLWWIGAPLEAALGRVRYITLYLLSGLAGSALTYLVASPSQPSLGASGAVFGLLGATAVLMRRLNYDMRPIIVLLVINLVITFYFSGIAWQAHIGGLVAGVIVAIGMIHAPRERRALVQYGTCALVFVVTLGMVLARSAMLT
ncbi:rhomboid family intramembrane serine protease [Streptomyces sp. NBC_00344]|uniref:rhomboid family intramembrane serine protease n=1 Tax=Streptomyces sp. NBC_00344 TaxID=2975720 RepID=UPI002E1B37F6